MPVVFLEMLFADVVQAIVVDPHKLGQLLGKGIAQARAGVAFDRPFRTLAQLSISFAVFRKRNLSEIFHYLGFVQ